MNLTPSPFYQSQPSVEQLRLFQPKNVIDQQPNAIFLRRLLDDVLAALDREDYDSAREIVEDLRRRNT